jgi:hypothetical protein
MAVAFACGCEKAPSGDVMQQASASASTRERRCSLAPGGDDASVSLVSELGQKLEVKRGTKCVVLDAGDALTRVRITEGPYLDAVAWAQTSFVLAAP